MQTKQYRNIVLVILLFCAGINSGKGLMVPQKSSPTDSIMNLHYIPATYKSTLAALAKMNQSMANRLDSSVQYINGLPKSWPMSSVYKNRMEKLRHWHLSGYADMVEEEFMLYQKINDIYSGEKDNDMPMMVRKPIIYIYPIKEQNTIVTLNFKGTDLYTWPKIDDKHSWTVTAQPDGMLKDSKGEEYPYLFWEAVLDDYSWINRNEGFVVPADETERFLMEKLKYLGLNSKEYTDFITYWAPQLRKNAFNIIRFETTEYSGAAPLTITPKPESMQRIMMVYEPLKERIEIKPQEIKPFTRKGYTVIEWGGMQMPEIFN